MTAFVRIDILNLNLEILGEKAGLGKVHICGSEDKSMRSDVGTDCQK